MNESSALMVFRLVATFEVDAELGGELERLRLELLRSESEPRAFRLRLWRPTFVQSRPEPDESGEVPEATEWQTFEDFGELFDAEDVEFEADSVAEAERQALQKLKTRLGQAAWARG